MTLPASYRQNFPPSTALPLDALCNAAFFFVAQWSPDLKRSQSRDVLRAIINKLYGASRGSLFHTQVSCSHVALADSLKLSREWTCKLIARLGSTGWIETSAPRLPDGKQEISRFRPGRMLKRLLVMLLKSKQRLQKTRVNTSSQQIPSKEQIEKNKTFLADLRQSLLDKMALSGRGEKKGGKKGKAKRQVRPQAARPGATNTETDLAPLGTARAEWG